MQTLTTNKIATGNGLHTAAFSVCLEIAAGIGFSNSLRS